MFGTLNGLLASIGRFQHMDETLFARVTKIDMTPHDSSFNIDLLRFSQKNFTRMNLKNMLLHLMLNKFHQPLNQTLGINLGTNRPIYPSATQFDLAFNSLMFMISFTSPT